MFDPLEEMILLRTDNLRVKIGYRTDSEQKKNKNGFIKDNYKGNEIKKFIKEDTSKLKKKKNCFRNSRLKII